MSQNSWIPDWERIPKWRQHAVSRLPTETISSQFGRRRESDRSQNISSNALQRENQVAGGGEGRRCRNEKSYYPDRDHGWQSKRSKNSCNNRKRQQHRSHKRTCESSARNEVKESDLETTGEREREREREREERPAWRTRRPDWKTRRAKRLRKTILPKATAAEIVWINSFPEPRTHEIEQKNPVCYEKERRRKQARGQRETKETLSLHPPQGGQKRVPKSAG